jgi:type III secretion system YscQ/HrcQ family protein
LNLAIALNFMKRATRTHRPNGSAQRSESVLAADPFATDLFAASGAVSAAAKVHRIEPHPEPDLTIAWHSRLKRVTPGQAQLSQALAGFPGDFSLQSVARVIARYTRKPLEEIVVKMAYLCEVEFAAKSLEIESGTSMFASWMLEPAAVPVTVEIDASFSAAIIDRLLGGEGSMPESLRALSPIERAVLEFLFLRLTRELNQEVGEPVFRLTGLTGTAPEWLQPAQRQSENTELSRGLVVAFGIHIAATQGFVRLFLPVETLDAIKGTRKLLKRDDAVSGPSERLKRYARIAPEVSLVLVVGQTELTFSELRQLECGDVIIVGRPFVRLQDGGLAGKARLRLGEGEGVIVNGRLSAPHLRDNETVDAGKESGSTGATNSIHLVVEAMTGSAVDMTEKTAEQIKIVEEAPDEEAVGEGAAVLENLLLNVQVELATRRFRIDELSQLRAGQLVDLGCQATDPVNLLVDGRRIARGELVDIEGRLGVRVTEIADSI